MRILPTLMISLLAMPAAMAQTSAQDPPAAAGGVTATPITPEASGAHSAPGASTEASPATPAVPSADASGNRPISPRRSTAPRSANNSGTR